MGRMFRIITEGSPETPSGLANEPTATPDEVVPFVEVGGPEGIVSSQPRPASRVLIPQSQATTAAPVSIPPDTIESVSDVEPRALSVAFHRFPKAGLRLAPTGVSTDLVAYHFPDHPVSGEYRTVRDEIRKQFEEDGPRVVLFTAASAVAGTTTVLMNFAASLAREPGSKVLVIDANFARPGVARRLGVADSPGLAEVLRQTTPLAWAVQPSAIENLHAFAAGATGEGLADALAADLPRLLAQLRQWFNWVLIDAGVWTETVARDAIGPACDAVYLVSRQSEIDRPEFTNLRSTMTGCGAVLRGYITTRA